MSTDYKLEKEVPFEHLLDGRLERYGVYKYEAEENEPGKYCVLTDGQNRIPVYGDGNVQIIKRCGLNNEALVLHAICEAFDTKAYSEFEPQFWGYETEEEWIAAEEYYDEHAKELYCAQLLDILDKGEIPEDANYRMLEDIELIEKILCESPEFYPQDHLLELVEKLTQKKDEQRAQFQALFKSNDGAPEDDLLTRIVNQAER